MNFRLKLKLFVRSFFLQAGWNYMKYQNLGLTFVMLPFLTHLYREDHDALPSVLRRYLDNFNTQPVMASFCIGAMAREEEEIAHAKSLADFKEKVTAWKSMKRSLSITTASLGDRLFWGTLKPLTLLMALFIWLLLGVNFFEAEATSSVSVGYALGAGAAAFFVFNVISLYVRWKGLSVSYGADERSCFGLTRFDWNRTIYNAKRLGMIFSIGVLLFSVYLFLKDFAPEADIHFITRALIVLLFVIISFITRRLRVPNMYLYLVAVVVFNIFCYL